MQNELEMEGGRIVRETRLLRVLIDLGAAKKSEDIQGWKRCSCNN